MTLSGALNQIARCADWVFLVLAVKIEFDCETEQLNDATHRRSRVVPAVGKRYGIGIGRRGAEV